jgi:hypothetical protein
MDELTDYLIRQDPANWRLERKLVGEETGDRPIYRLPVPEYLILLARDEEKTGVIVAHPFARSMRSTLLGWREVGPIIERQKQNVEVWQFCDPLFARAYDLLGTYTAAKASDMKDEERNAPLEKLCDRLARDLLTRF